MSGNPAEGGDAPPIDAEFETAADAEAGTGAARSPRGARPARRSHTVTLPELLVASAAAAVLGALGAITVSSAGGGASTGTLAQELDTLTASGADLADRAQQSANDIAAVRTRLEAQADRLGQREADDQSIKTELAAISGQLSALAGTGDGRPVEGATASQTPLGALLARMTRLEDQVREASEAPQTTRQMQQAIHDLSVQIASLEEANTQLTASLNQRQAALTALETGLLNAGAARGTSDAGPSADTRARTPVAAVAESQKIRAVSAIETAARSGRPFRNAYKTLALLSPRDPDVAALADIARRGGPTISDLRRGFARSARKADWIAARQSDDGWNWLRSAVSGVVRFERPGAGPEAEGMIREAQRAMDVGDLRGAVDAVDAVTGPTAGAFHDWRLQALRRAELDERLDVLNAKLLTAEATGPEG
ncbi:MAG: hypothetical protein GC155_16015 [Alphaproteobacteria bacterium]|nr:hypothetical protein [Alphaproteobacteria bacterium]